MYFYESLAADYDTVVGAAARAQAVEDFSEHLVSRHAVRSALDVACGTGNYALALAKRGVQVTAADISPAMITQARRRSHQQDLHIDWLCAPMQQLTDVTAGPFDAVLCMGNSIPHLLTDDDLHRALQSFHQLLSPGGLAVVHLLNYRRILARRERIVGITRSHDTQYVRFYDFLAENVRFNVLTIRWSGDKCSHDLHSTELRPYLPDQLTQALEHADFTEIHQYGDLAFKPFDHDDSDVLLLTARRP